MASIKTFTALNKITASVAHAESNPSTEYLLDRAARVGREAVMLVRMSIGGARIWADERAELAKDRATEAAHAANQAINQATNASTICAPCGVEKDDCEAWHV